MLCSVVWRHVCKTVFCDVNLTTDGPAGYGDVIPVTHFERTYIILATVVGGGLYAYLV